MLRIGTFTRDLRAQGKAKFKDFFFSSQLRKFISSCTFFIVTLFLESRNSGSKIVFPKASCKWPRPLLECAPCLLLFFPSRNLQIQIKTLVWNQIYQEIVWQPSYSSFYLPRQSKDGVHIFSTFVLWSHVPKNVFVGPHTLKIATLDAVLSFSDGSSAQASILKPF